MAILGQINITNPGSFSTGVRGENKGTGNLGIGVWGSQNGSGWGVYGSVSGLNGRGVYGKATGVQGYAIYGEANESLGRGVYGVSSGSSGRGVYGEATGGQGRGVYGLATGSAKGVVGAADFGSCDFDAIGMGTNYCTTSSKRWKTDIKNIPNPLSKLSRLRGVNFTWDSEHGGHRDIGFIAEEVGKILPEIVVYESNKVDASSMDYSMMTPLLVEAGNAMRQEYQNKFDQQQSQIDQLSQELAELRTLIKAQMGKMPVKNNHTVTDNQSKFNVK